MVPLMMSGRRIAQFVPQALDGEDGGLGVERVVDRLDDEDVGAAFDERAGGLEVGLVEVFEVDVARARIVDVR